MTLFQFVCFETPLPREAFLAGWAPFASGFLARGLARLVLSERIGPSGFAYVSRNAWPDDRFAETFRGQLPADAGGGPVRAIQGGVFRLAASVGVDPLVANRAATKLVAFVDRGSDIAALSSLVSLLPLGATWARYERIPTVEGGRFEAVFELFAPRSPELELAAPMREILSLPEH